MTTVSDALAYNAAQGNLIAVRRIVEGNISLSLVNALIGSAARGHLPVVQYLVERGANVRAWRNRPLIESASWGHLSVVQYLVDHGADVRDEKVLRYSAKNGHVPVVQYLLSCGSSMPNTPKFCIHLSDNAISSVVVPHYALEFLQYRTYEQKLADEIVTTMCTIDRIPQLLDFHFRTYFLTFLYPERTVRALLPYRRHK